MDEAKKGSEEIDEAINPRIARKPIAPTKAMREAHEVHHADYREWCDHCVAGKVSAISTRPLRRRKTALLSLDSTMPS